MESSTEITLHFNGEIADFIRSEVENGSFHCANDYLQALIHERYNRQMILRDEAIARGLADADVGRTMTLDQGMDLLQAKFG